MEVDRTLNEIECTLNDSGWKQNDLEDVILNIKVCMNLRVLFL